MPCLSNYAANLPSKLIQNSPDCDNFDKHIFFSSDKSTVKDSSLKVLGSSTLELTWEKPRDKYKVFSYRAFIKWTNPHGLQNMREVCHGNATLCVYNWDVTEAQAHNYYVTVMAYVVHEIPLVRIVGRLF